VAGNVIWSSDLIESLSSNSAGGKGGGASTSVQKASYAVDCAIAFGMGALTASIGGIRTIWADSKIIYNDGVWSAGMITDAEFYFGTMSQNPSPLMEAYLGAGNVPSYRGVAYMVLHRLQLANFGNRIPNMTFEFYPADAATAPRYLGSKNPALLSRSDSVGSYNAMPPLPLARSGSSITRMLVGGILQTGLTFQFATVEMDVSGSAPVEISRTLSASITRASDLCDVSWAWSADGAHVVFYMQHSDPGSPAAFALYTVATRSFGALLSHNLGTASAHNQIAWLDAQRFVLIDSVGGAVGVRVYAAAGTSITALGFYDVWGAGSGSTRFQLPFAQFCPLSGGLCMLMTDALVAPNTLYARSLCWNNNSLQIGSEITVSNSLGAFSSGRAALLKIADNEYVLARMGTASIQLLSFTANFTSVTVSRIPTSIAVSPSGDLSVSFNGSRLCFMHEIFSISAYRYGEITLTATSFTLTLASTVITGTYGGVVN
ncbi:MAG: hypothetical protein EB059_10960, partial [Alphaproteobacteria bacterium]|nr:hypothetical protein [Alphaproteobacteria bacterium]